jgi:hypothetical protein
MRSSSHKFSCAFLSSIQLSTGDHCIDMMLRPGFDACSPQASTRLRSRKRPRLSQIPTIHDSDANLQPDLESKESFNATLRSFAAGDGLRGGWKSTY